MPLKEVAPWAPVGPAGAALEAAGTALAARGIPLLRVLPDWDARAWPHATHGFFRFRTQITALLAAARARAAG